MSAKHTVEEVQTMAAALTNSPVPREWKLKAGKMLTAYAERIKADESSLPVGVCVSNGYGGKIAYLDEQLPLNTLLFTHPPAQAAQVDNEKLEAQARVAIALREPNSSQAGQVASELGAAHRTAEPVAKVDALPDPLGCNDCTHPDCGRYNGPRSVECRAMLNNACARPAGHQPYRAPATEPAAQGEAVSINITDIQVFELAQALHSNRSENTALNYLADKAHAYLLQLLATRQSLTAKTLSVPDAKAMACRFMGWRLPDDFAPDCGISFDGRKDDEWNKNKTWPVGTNLLTVDQAEQMFRYVLDALADDKPNAVPVERVAEPDDFSQFRAAVADWDDDCDTEVPHHVLMRLVEVGFLAVDRFILTKKGQEALAAAPSPGESSRADECTCSDISFGRICSKHNRWNV